MNPDYRAPDGQRLGLTPKLLTATAIVALCAAGWVSRPGTEPAPVSSPAAPKAAPEVVPTTPVAPLQIPTTPPTQASVWTKTATTAVIPAAATWADIPAAAQAAYQRAATVINSADASCHLDWSLLAGIGKVESNHGRANGGQLSSTGLVTPALIGVALDGTNGTALIADTDGGAFDGDATYDHAVGPMQFLPTTWTTVGVDADGDGQRNPQDIDDAALAAAVYLCSGSEDLADPAGQRAAVLTYNHSESYADLVLADAASYASGYASGAGVVNAAYLGMGYQVAATESAAEKAARKTSSKKTHGISAETITKPAKTSKPSGGGKDSTTDPATPTDPTDPSTDPTTPTDPTDPGTDPTTPTDPTDPTTDPTDPATPTDPIDPTDPATDPEECSTEPASDADAASDETATQDDCTDPSDPAQPGDQPSASAGSDDTPAKTEENAG